MRDRKQSRKSEPESILTRSMKDSVAVQIPQPLRSPADSASRGSEKGGGERERANSPASSPLQDKSARASRASKLDLAVRDINKTVQELAYDPTFFRAVVAEFIGTMLFVFLGTGIPL